MTWTAPRTWVAGELVTATLLNTHLRDELKMLSDPWAAYTPVWTTTSTAPTLGNGTLVGSVLQVGKWVRFRIDLTIGSTTNGGPAASTWFFTLPVAAAVSIYPVGQAVCSTGGTSIPRVAFSISPTAVVAADMAGARVGVGVPFAWGSTAELHIAGEYEAA